ncbi:MAG: carboxymuconolactone decarboxylase family protein [Desulfobacteraceae bacterium]|nr:MAG: carboxymuconolactone decarboxylase family protein [Desulfobacteraceae bacterium]
MFGYFDIPAEFINHVFGNLYTRDVLTRRERELCAVAALCVLNRGNDLKSHIIAAVRAGATRSELVEVILQMSTYGRMPVCIEGLTIGKEVFDKTKSSN